MVTEKRTKVKTLLLGSISSFLTVFLSILFNKSPNVDPSGDSSNDNNIVIIAQQQEPLILFDNDDRVPPSPESSTHSDSEYKPGTPPISDSGSDSEFIQGKVKKMLGSP